MLDKMVHINEVDDSIRRFCVFEPRGAAQMSTNLLFPPTRPDADAGFIVLQGDQAHAMSGSNCICVVTVLLETGLLPMTEPETIVRLDTPAGLVTARAECGDGKCQRVHLDMTPTFVEGLDVPVDVPGIGTVSVDIAFGGIYYALIEAKQLDLTIEPGAARTLVDVGSKIHRAARDQIVLNHPESASLNTLSYVMFVDTQEDGELVGATIMPPGRIDRSPCGTGNSARLAVRHARDEVSVGDSMTARSIIDSTFQVTLKGQTEIAGRAAILPQISGRGWIHGIHQIGLDPSDPYPHGFKVSDCWGDAFDLLN